MGILELDDLQGAFQPKTFYGSIEHWLSFGKSEKEQQILSLSPEQAPVTDHDPDSSTQKMLSVSEMLPDFFVWEPHYKW